MTSENDAVLVPWERFWRSVDNAEEDWRFNSGFLQTWPAIFAHIETNPPKKTCELLDRRCLVLCGEPGMGKSKVLEQHRSEIEGRVGDGGQLYWRSFRETLDPSHLLQDLKASRQWGRWVAGSELTLLIDGLDEGLASAPQFVSALAAELQGKPVERLRLILVCRDAEWPVEDGRALTNLWRTDHVGRFQLERLSHSDAILAAKKWGLSESRAEEFLSAVTAAGVEDFAARPITLRMLFDEFQANAQLPGTRSEIFRRGCLRLCRENDPARAKRLRASKPFQFTDQQLLPIAARIGAYIILGRFSGIAESPSAAQLDFSKLIPVEGTEESRPKVEAALATPLFSDAGNQSRAFAHQSYAEFLAAEHLAKFPLNQVLDFVCAPTALSKRVVPQLYELAAWLAISHQSFGDWLIDSEPEVLLRNDATALTESQRQRLVAGLLEKMAREEVFYNGAWPRFYTSFCHPKLVEQLRPYLRNSEATHYVRCTAIDLAEFCNPEDLLDEILAVAKDVHSTAEVREHALDAVCRVIPRERLSDLVPFAQCEAGPDRFDQLRGAALQALVPKHWPVSSALPWVLRPSNSSFSGKFHFFCRRKLPEHIDVADLPELLSALGAIYYPFQKDLIRRLASRAVTLAVRNLDRDEIGSALLQFVRTKLREGQLPYHIDEPDWHESVGRCADTRRRLATFLVGASGATREEIYELYSHRWLPLETGDCAWLIEQLRFADGNARHLWVSLCGRLKWLFFETMTCRDLFMEACDDLPDLAAEIGWHHVVRLNSEEANMGREFLKHEKHIDEDARRSMKKPGLDVGQMLQAALSAAITDTQEWATLCFELHRNARGAFDFINTLNLTATPRWQGLTAAEREQVSACARNFLRVATPSAQRQPTGEWPIQVSWALWLLKDLADQDEEVRGLLKDKWFEALFSQPLHGAEDEQILAELGVALDSSRATTCLRDRLMQTGLDLGIANVLAAFERTWRPEFTALLLNLARSQPFVGTRLSSALKFLARQDPGAVRSWLDEELKAENPNDLPTAVALAIGLAPSELWSRAKSLIERDRNLSLKSLQTLADLQVSSIGMVENLTTLQLGDLFLLLEAAFPSSASLKLTEEEVSPRERVEQLRTSLIQRLQKEGDDQACEQLSRLAGAAPHWRTHLRLRLWETQIAQLRNAWPGVPIDVLQKVEENHARRWVRSEDDLQELILESLERFNDDLNRTDHPTVPDLWNEKPKLRPKDETTLTLKIVRWLKSDLNKNGVAVGCQVEPSLVHETDIEVWAQLGGQVPTGSRFVITIEVKCSFNQEVAASMEKQLVGEYLLKLNRTHGIYLVGWYKGEGWSPKNNPLKAKTVGDATSAINLLVQASLAAHPNLKVDAICLNCEFPQAFRKRS